MKWIFIKIGTAGLLVILVALSWLLYFGREGPAVHLTLTSPNGVYEVQLDETVDRFDTAIQLFSSRRFPTTVNFTVRKQGQTKVQDALFWEDSSGDYRIFEDFN